MSGISFARVIIGSVVIASFLAAGGSPGATPEMSSVMPASVQTQGFNARGLSVGDMIASRSYAGTPNERTEVCMFAWKTMARTRTKVVTYALDGCGTSRSLRVVFDPIRTQTRVTGSVPQTLTRVVERRVGSTWRVVSERRRRASVTVNLTWSATGLPQPGAGIGGGFAPFPRASVRHPAVVSGVISFGVFGQRIAVPRGHPGTMRLV